MFRHLAGETEQELRLQAELLQLAASGRGSVEDERQTIFFIILIRFRGGGEAERGTEDLTKLARCSRKSDTQDQRGEDKKVDYLIYRSLPRIYRYQKFQLGKGSGYQDKDQDISEISIRKNG